MKRIVWLFIFMFVTHGLLRADEITLTLDEAVAIALRDNRDILLKTEEVEKAKAKISEAKADLFPTLSFTGKWTDTYGYYTKDISQTTTQTTLKQYLYKGGKIINTIRYNGHNFEVTQALLDRIKLETILNIKNAFYTLLLASEFVELNRAIIENTKEHLDFVRERFRSGEASESEILKIEAALNSVKQAYEASLNQMESSRVLLNNLLYLDKDTKIKPAAQFNYEPVEVAYDEAFLKAMKNRPEIKQYEAKIEADKRLIEIAKADNRPEIYASWDYYSRSHAVTTTVNTKNWNDYSFFGFTFSWPIFDGWRTKAKVEQAILDLKETQLLKEKTVRDIVAELKNAYLSLKNAIAKIRARESEIKVYRDNLSVVKEKYQQGIVSLLDLSDAQLKYTISCFNKDEAIYDYIIAKASFDKATGGW